MSKTSDYGHDNLDHLNPRAGADLRLRLLTLKDLAHAFLEELGTVGDGNGTAAAPSPRKAQSTSTRRCAASRSR